MKKASVQQSKKAPFLIFVGYLFALSGSVIGVLIGETIRSKQITFSNGVAEYKYTKETRKHGKFISNLAATIFYLGILLGLFA